MPSKLRWLVWVCLVVASVGGRDIFADQSLLKLTLEHKKDVSHLKQIYRQLAASAKRARDPESYLRYMKVIDKLSLVNKPMLNYTAGAGVKKLRAPKVQATRCGGLKSFRTKQGCCIASHIPNLSLLSSLLAYCQRMLVHDSAFAPPAKGDDAIYTRELCGHDFPAIQTAWHHLQLSLQRCCTNYPTAALHTDDDMKYQWNIANAKAYHYVDKNCHTKLMQAGVQELRSSIAGCALDVEHAVRQSSSCDKAFSNGNKVGTNLAALTVSLYAAHGAGEISLSEDTTATLAQCTTVGPTTSILRIKGRDCMARLSTLLLGDKEAVDNTIHQARTELGLCSSRMSEVDCVGALRQVMTVGGEEAKEDEKEGGGGGKGAGKLVTKHTTTNLRGLWNGGAAQKEKDGMENGGAKKSDSVERVEVRSGHKSRATSRTASGQSQQPTDQHTSSLIATYEQMIVIDQLEGDRQQEHQHQLQYQKLTGSLYMPPAYVLPTSARPAGPHR
jgi:hypothetical protein